MEWQNCKTFMSGLSPLDLAVKYFPNYTSSEMEQIICYAKVMKEIAIKRELSKTEKEQQDEANSAF